MLKRLSSLRPGGGHPNRRFAFWFLLLNVLLFLPLYLFNQETSTLLPATSLFADGWWMGVNRLFLWRDNLDPFRMSLELTFLTALWVNVRPLRRQPFRAIIASLYLLTVCYYLYEAIVVSIYLTDPVFYSQYYLARDGLPFLFRHLQASLWFYALGLGGLAAGLGLLLILVNRLLDSAAQPTLHWALRITMVLLAGFCLFAGVRYQRFTARPEMVVSSLGFKLQHNIAASRQLYYDVAGFDDHTVHKVYDFSNQRLRQPPDLYFIFIESYGSVLYKRPHFTNAYLALLTELEGQLQDQGWHARSALSESPTWGGGSWMAYTSLMFGLRIDSHPQYLALFNKYQLEGYPDLGRTLRAQGYHYAWVSSIAEELDERTWAKYLRFTGVDEWLRHRDLAYTGPHYGWGPAPPDQYVLNYAHQALKAKTDKPLLFVTITQNSHYPWVPHPVLVDDWRTLGAAAPATMANGETVEEKRLNYLHAIDYQLRMLADFIVRNGDEKSLFFLIGDHQPPQVSRRDDGWDTPFHIIGKDKALVDAFAAYGFSKGLQVTDPTPTVRHEGFYSMLMRVLLQRYGARPVSLPPYLPNGATHADVDGPAVQ